MASQKKCNGTGKAKGFGCGEKLDFVLGANGLKSYKAKYGLGFKCKCYNNFLLNSSQGNEILSKAKLTGKKRTEDKQRKEKYHEKKQKKESLRTKSEWEEMLQKVINTIVRTIDEGHNCISSGKRLIGKYDAGHYYSVGGNPTLRFNLHNIFAQSVNDNQYNGGNPIDYIKNIKTLFGEQYATDLINMRAKHKILKLSIPELQEAIKQARAYLKIIKQHKEDRAFTLKERIELRVEGNIYIGIYTE